MTTKVHLKILYLSSAFVLSFSVAFSQPKDNIHQSAQSPKPTITINGNSCSIGYADQTCLTKTCDSATIFVGEQIEFCSSSNIDLSGVYPSYYMEWNFAGSTFPSSQINYTPSVMPICYQSGWAIPGDYLVSIYYKGSTSANCPPNYLPSHWIIPVKVSQNLLETTEIASSGHFFSINPNPITDQTNFAFSLIDTGRLAISLIDLYGKEIESMSDLTQNSISNKIQALFSKVAGGVYFIRIRTEKYSETKKIVLIK